MVSSSAWFSVSPAAFWRWGQAALWGMLGLGLLVTLYLAWAAPEMLPFFPVVLLAGAAAWWLFRHPMVNLVVVLAGSVVIMRRAEGLQAVEVLYGLYYLSFMAYWFGTRFFAYREGERVLDTQESRTLLFFLIGSALTVPLTLLFGGSMRAVLSEGISLAMLAIYFPVKELCVRHRRGLVILLAVIAWIGLFAAVQNMINYQQLLANATQVWQVTRGRVASHDTWLAVPSLFFLVLLIFARNWKVRGALLTVFLIYFSGLILTQSRGYWLAFLLGAFLLFVLVDRRRKKQLVLLGAVGATAVLGLGLLFIGEYMMLVLGGLAERFTSLGTATTSDLSLVNRLLESQAVLQRIGQNPVLGHGMGVSYYFYDITFKHTRVDTFIHNGYLSLWFKFGLWGLGLMIYTWGWAFWHGIQAFRHRHAELLPRLCGLGAAMCLAALALAANTSNPFHHVDSCFAFGMVAGIASGVFVRTREANRLMP